MRDIRGIYRPIDIALPSRGRRTREGPVLVTNLSRRFYAPHKSRHRIRKVKRHDDGPHTFSVCLLCMVYRGLTRVNLVAREGGRGSLERLMTVIKCDVSKNGYQKFGRGFTLVIPPPSPPFLDLYFSHENIRNMKPEFPRFEFLSPRKFSTRGSSIFSINKIRDSNWNYISNRIIIHVWKAAPVPTPSI